MQIESSFEGKKPGTVKACIRGSWPWQGRGFRKYEEWLEIPGEEECKRTLVSREYICRDLPQRAQFFKKLRELEGLEGRQQGAGYEMRWRHIGRHQDHNAKLHQTIWSHALFPSGTNTRKNISVCPFYQGRYKDFLLHSIFFFKGEK
jgi:hypothetical protein